MSRIVFAAGALVLALSSALPEAWFQKNVVATDKKAYVHLFWNAEGARAALAGKERRVLVARAARHLAAREMPKGATADLVKLDVVFVKERDGYGMPRWETLEKVAHVEFGRARLVSSLPDGTAPTEAEIAALFTVFEIRP